MDQEPALQDLFMYLVREGFPLGVRDYQDALKALRRGYGLGRRKDLLRLCQTLWSRTEEEKRVLDSLFGQLDPPTDEEIKNLFKKVEDTSFPLKDLNLERRPEQNRTEQDKKKQQQATRQPGLDFTSSTNKTGIGLPAARIVPGKGEYFILTPRLLVSLRRLTVIWRRFRATKRDGPKTELDLDATIEQKCRDGIITHPVMIPARRNQVKLIVMVDVSPSMVAWRDFNKVLTNSLQRGQFGWFRVYYFHNTPDGVLYEKEGLTRPKPIASALKEHQDCTLLIVSDGGAARGIKSRERIGETGRFLKSVSMAWYPVVWLNPLMPERWEKTTAAEIRKLLNNRMYQLNEDGLIRAIDVLRGKTTR